MGNHLRASRFALQRSALLTAAAAIATALAMKAPEWLQAYPVMKAATAVALWLGLGAMLAYVAVRGRADTVNRTVLELAVVSATMLLLEVAMTYAVPGPHDYRARRERAAAELGRPVDSRKLSDVVRELQSDGLPALPNVSRTWPQLPEVREHLPKDFYPLSHASNARIVKCNESGQYQLFHTDDFGFNNPKRLLHDRHIDIAVVGESFALGYCIPETQTLVGQVRKRYPRTANFAMAATHPVAELASFREYVEPFRPRLVLWTVNLGYLDTAAELAHPVLRRYLDPDFSQGLIRRQSETDRFIHQLAVPVQQELESRTARVRADRWKHLWKLPAIRARLATALGLTAAGKPLDLSGLLRCLQIARASTASWGGEFVVLLVPTYNEVVRAGGDDLRARDRVVQEVLGLGIPVIDGIALFRAQDDRADLYTLRTVNHPNARGYSLLADRVLADLEHRLPSRLADADERSRDDGS